jgi:hypothetical protein
MFTTPTKQHEILRSTISSPPQSIYYSPIATFPHAQFGHMNDKMDSYRRTSNYFSPKYT